MFCIETKTSSAAVIEARVSRPISEFSIGARLATLVFTVFDLSFSAGGDTLLRLEISELAGGATVLIAFATAMLGLFVRETPFAIKWRARLDAGFF